jgi:hypothetical protein
MEATLRFFLTPQLAAVEEEREILMQDTTEDPAVEGTSKVSMIQDLAQTAKGLMVDLEIIIPQMASLVVVVAPKKRVKTKREETVEMEETAYTLAGRFPIASEKTDTSQVAGEEAPNVLSEQEETEQTMAKLYLLEMAAKAVAAEQEGGKETLLETALTQSTAPEEAVVEQTSAGGQTERELVATVEMESYL